MQAARQVVEELFPDHDIGGELGRGSFGSVWAARHRELGRDVAIKLLLGTGDDDRARFRREARLLAGLRHPHVVSVFDYRESGDARAIVMEHLAGGTLAAQGTQYSAAGHFAVALASATALEHVHRAGVLHRDVTPGNVMFDGAGHVRVTDFGVAAGGNDDVFATAAGAAGLMVGTPGYASPEACAAAVGEAAAAVSAASDQYSLAVVLFEQLTGRLPHDRAGGVLALCRRRLTEPPVDLSSVRPDLPGVVTAVVMRALHRHPADRFAAVEEFAVTLASAVRDEGGPDWLARSGVELADPGPVRAAAVGAGSVPVTTPVTEPTAPVVIAPAAPPATPPAVTAPRSPDRGRRGVLLGAAGVGVAALAGGGAWWATRDDPGKTAGSTTGTSGATSTGAKITEVWSATTGASVLSSPVVSGDRVVVGSNDGKLYGLDASTGAITWTVGIGEGAGSTPVRSSPVIDGDRVLVAGYDGQLRSLALADGAEQWKVSVGMRVSSRLRVVDGMVLLGADHLRAYDVATGAQRWSADGTGIVSSSSPAFDGRTAVVGSEDHRLYVVDLDSGAVVWSYLTGDRVLSSPVVAGGRAIVGSVDDRLYAVDLATRKEAWTADLGAPVNSSPTVVGDVVIVGTGAGTLVARSLDDGSPRWLYRTGDRVDSSPLVLGDRVVVGSNDQYVHVVDVGGRRIGRFPTGGAVVSSPAAIENDAVVGSLDGKVYRLRIA